MMKAGEFVPKVTAATYLAQDGIVELRNVFRRHGMQASELYCLNVGKSALSEIASSSFCWPGPAQGSSLWHATVKANRTAAPNSFHICE